MVKGEHEHIEKSRTRSRKSSESEGKQKVAKSGESGIRAETRALPKVAVRSPIESDVAVC